jgi:hypothetical protein
VLSHIAKSASGVNLQKRANGAILQKRANGAILQKSANGVILQKSANAFRERHFTQDYFFNIANLIEYYISSHNSTNNHLFQRNLTHK